MSDPDALVTMPLPHGPAVEPCDDEFLRLALLDARRSAETAARFALLRRRLDQR